MTWHDQDAVDVLLTHLISIMLSLRHDADAMVATGPHRALNDACIVLYCRAAGSSRATAPAAATAATRCVG
jgi:hypothetical protein